MIVNINKPVGVTSHWVVNQVRKITNERRVGHGGTLDPMAEGVLILAVRRQSTRKLSTILKNTDKEYLATIVLGATSTTDDVEGEIKPHRPEIIETLTSDMLSKVLAKFQGKIEQTPPRFSAIKIKGKPAYKLARAGLKPKMQKRDVFIESIKLIDFSPPAIIINTTVSSGTYIRALARDIGDKLGTGAYLKALKRTRVGDFSIKDSITLEDLAKAPKIMDTD